MLRIIEQGWKLLQFLSKITLFLGHMALAPPPGLCTLVPAALSEIHFLGRVLRDGETISKQCSIMCSGHWAIPSSSVIYSEGLTNMSLIYSISMVI